jgi:hypothetical protein
VGRERPQREGVPIKGGLVVGDEASHLGEVVLMELRFLTRGLASSKMMTSKMRWILKARLNSTKERIMMKNMTNLRLKLECLTAISYPKKSPRSTRGVDKEMVRC